jgi:hypothetical protein
MFFDLQPSLLDTTLYLEKAISFPYASRPHPQPFSQSEKGAGRQRSRQRFIRFDERFSLSIIVIQWLMMMMFTKYSGCTHKYS